MSKKTAFQVFYAEFKRQYTGTKPIKTAASEKWSSMSEQQKNAYKSKSKSRSRSRKPRVQKPVSILDAFDQMEVNTQKENEKYLRDLAKKQKKYVDQYNAQSQFRALAPFLKPTPVFIDYIRRRPSRYVNIHHYRVDPMNYLDNMFARQFTAGVSAAAPAAAAAPVVKATPAPVASPQPIRPAAPSVAALPIVRRQAMSAPASFPRARIQEIPTWAELQQRKQAQQFPHSLL